MNQAENQVMGMHPLFFDPIGKVVTMDQVDGKMSMHYVDDEQAVHIEEDGSVSFFLKAPNAKTVEVGGLGGTLGTEKMALAKEEDGCFRANVKGIKPGFHYYFWYVDGQKVLNQNAPVCYGCFQTMNFFEVPDKEKDFFDIKDVPHGEVQIHKYVSKVSGHVKECYVYTPPCYGTEAGNIQCSMYNMVWEKMRQAGYGTVN